jgi:hypothetical protein
VGRIVTRGSLLVARSSLRPPRERDRDVARTAQQSIVFKSAFAATIGDGDDVVRFPSRTCGTPCASSGTIGHGRFRSRPLSVRLEHVEPAQLTNALVSFLDLLSNVPRAASNLPFVDARITAEGATRRLDDRAAPATDRFARRIALGLAPLIRGNDTRAPSAHARSYRPQESGSLAVLTGSERPGPTLE